jgi:hypothetical protein
MEAAALLERTKSLEDRGRELAGLMNAAVAGLVAVIAEALDDGAWQGWGIHTPEHWAALRFGLAAPRARRLVAAARALKTLPQVRTAFAAGELSEDLVAVIANAEVKPRNDEETADLARYTTVNQLRRALSTLPRDKKQKKEEASKKPDNAANAENGGDKPDTKPEPEPDPDPRPHVGFGYREDGTWGLHARLGAAEGAIVEKALTAARNQLFHARYGDDADPALRNDITWHDALVHLAKVGLDAMDPATRARPGRMPTERFLVNLYVNAADPDAALLHLGPALPKAVREELTCDALVRTWIADQTGNVNLGRTQRTVDDKMRTVVECRDRGCRVPGCSATRWLRIHHIIYWEHHGPTDTWNLVALCPVHHRAVHRGELRVSGNADAELAFTTRDGRTLRASPPTPPRRPLPDTARDLGLHEPQWQNCTGERADWRWLPWNDWAGKPPPGFDVNQN